MIRNTFMTIGLLWVLTGCNPNSAEIDLLNAQIKDLEDQVASLATFQRMWHSVPRPYHQPYVIPDANAPVSDELNDWYEEQRNIDEGIMSWSSSDPRVNVFHKKAYENLEDFIALVANEGDSGPYLVMALSPLITSENRELLLPYLSSSRAIANIAKESGLFHDYPEEFKQAFLEWYAVNPFVVPQGLIEFAAMQKDAKLTAMVAELAVYSLNREAAFEYLRIAGYPNLPLLAESVWDQLSFNTDHYSRFDTAFVAAKYTGKLEALYELSALWELYKEEENSYFRWQLEELIYMQDLNELSEHLLELTFNEDAYVWEKL